MTLRSFVKIKTVTVKNPLDEGFASIGNGINNIGETTSSIAGNFHQINELIKFEREWLSNKGRKQVQAVEDENTEKKKTFKDMLAGLKKKFAKFGRKEKEKAAEKGLEDPEVKKAGNKKLEAIKGPFKKVFEWIGKILEGVFTWFIGYGALDWLSKQDSAKITKTFKAIWAIGKFMAKLIGWGVNGILNGLTSTIGQDLSANPVKRALQGSLGAIKFLGGVALLATAAALAMPWKVLGNTAMIREVFGMHSSMQAESAADRKARIGGYRDKKTGVIYSKEEYEANMKSAKRADAARAKKAGKGMSSNLYQDSMKDRFQTQYNKRKKGPIQRLGQKNRIRFKKAFGTSQRGGGGVGKGILSKGTQKGFAVFGGITRMASGLASGEDATQAVGAGVGQAAGGILGTVAGTALLGPFLGPFAPMVGNVIGSFLGEFVGKTFLPTIKPLFEPIGRYFQLLGGYVSDVFKNAGGFELVGQIGELFGTIWTIVSPLLGGLWDFIKFVTGTSFKIIGESVGWVLTNAKRLMNPGSVAGGIVDFMTFGLTDMDGMSRAAGGPVPAPPQMAGGGLIGPQLSIMQTIGGAMLAGVVGGISMLGFAGPAALAFIGGDIARLGKLFGTGGKSGGGSGLASAMGTINTGNLKDSDTQEADAMVGIQQKLIEVAKQFNKMVVKMASIMEKDKEVKAKDREITPEGRAKGGNVNQWMHGNKKADPGILGGGTYDYYGHGTQTNAHDHFSFNSRTSAVKAFKALKAAGFHPYEMEGFGKGVIYKHSKTGGHYGPVGGPYTPNDQSDGTALDIPWSTPPYGISGPLGKKDWDASNKAARIVAGLTGAVPPTVAKRATVKEEEEKVLKQNTDGPQPEVEQKKDKDEFETLETALMGFAKKIGELNPAGRIDPTTTGNNNALKIQSSDIHQQIKQRTANQKAVTQMMNKERNDKNRRNFIAPGGVYAKKVTQQVINKSGGRQNVYYTKPSQVLTLC